MCICTCVHDYIPHTRDVVRCNPGGVIIAPHVATKHLTADNSTTVGVNSLPADRTTIIARQEDKDGRNLAGL